MSINSFYAMRLNARDPLGTYPAYFVDLPPVNKNCEGTWYGVWQFIYIFYLLNLHILLELENIIIY